MLKNNSESLLSMSMKEASKLALQLKSLLAIVPEFQCWLAKIIPQCLGSLHWAGEYWVGAG